MNDNDNIENEHQHVDHLKASVQEALEIAGEAPEPYRLKAFELAFEALVGGRTSVSRPTPTTHKPTRRPRTTIASLSEPKSEDDEIAAALAAGNDAVERYSFIPQLTDAKMKIFGVLKFANDEFGIDGLTEGQITTILVKKFRVSMGRSTPSTAVLRAEPGELNRQPTGRKTKYSLMTKGEEALRHAIGALSPPARTVVG